MNPQQQLQTFEAQYTGVANVGDTPQNLGQCVGLIEKWLDVFNLPHIWGNAIDLPANAPAANYTVINNTPTGSPSPGDVFVLKEPYGATLQNGQTVYLGHCGVVIVADLNQVTMFEANDPLGAAPQIKSYSYTNDCQWIHPNIFSPTVTQTVTDQQSTDLLNAQITATSNCLTQLKSATEQNATLQQELTTAQNQIQSLQEQLTDEQAKITALQTQLDGEQKEIVNLNTQIETQASSNKDYATEIYNLTHANSDLTASFNSVVDGLGVTRTNKTIEQITQDSLSKEDDIDLLLKAAGVASGILHNIAIDLGVNPTNLSDKEVGDKIIQYVQKLPTLTNIAQSASTVAKNISSKNSNLFGKFFAWLGLWQ